MALVKAYLNAISTRNTTQLGQTHAANYVEFGPRWNSPGTKQTMMQNVKNIWDMTSEVRYDRIRMVSVSVSGDELPEYNGNWVFVWGVFVGKSKDGDKEVFLDIYQTFKIENGLITLSLVFFNEFDSRIQQGLVTGD
jgi:hypothetical protein